tara:strand:- start:1244 stop:1474 length:231 start_codon:yes stop_codon:yes gene_type:complete
MKNKMKKLLLFTLFILSANSFAQTVKTKLPKPGIISGEVIDSSTKEVLPYVSILIRDMNRKIITGGITDEKKNVRN